MPAMSARMNTKKLNDSQYFLSLPDRSVTIKRGKHYDKNSKLLTRPRSTGDDIFWIDDGHGMVTFIKQAGYVKSVTIYDHDKEKLYEGDVANDGTLTLFEKDPHDYICIAYQHDQQNNTETANIVVDPTPSDVTLSQVQNLQSRPDASKVLYIDYWGGVFQHSAWNGGNAINYRPYSSDDNNSFSQSELHNMYTAWAEMAEDYAPFDVNITTMASVFNGAVNTNRAKLIATATNWRGGGGVAYVNIFGKPQSSNGGRNVGWTFNSSARSMGMTHSHESGHQMGLSHDGNSSTSYYSGHNNWGPIMGAPFGGDYVQWNKGEYSSSNQTQNDLNIIKDKLGTVPDDVGNTNSSAKLISIVETNDIGFIRPQGLGNDTDVFYFRQGMSSQVTVGVRPLFEGNNSAGTGSNLSMRATLRNSSGGVVKQENPSNDPTSNVLNFVGQLMPDIYYLTIENKSPNTNPSTGFTEYGNGGYYQVSVSGGFEVPNPDLVINSISLTPSSVKPDSGDSVTINARAKNTGFNPVSSYTIKFYKSIDKVITMGDTELNSQNIFADLTTSQVSSNLSHTFTAPLEKGNYYYGVCLSNSSSSEVTTSNNCSTAVTLSVDNEMCVPIKAKNGKLALVCL